MENYIKTKSVEMTKQQFMLIIGIWTRTIGVRLETTEQGLEVVYDGKNYPICDGYSYVIGQILAAYNKKQEARWRSQIVGKKEETEY